MHVSLSLDSDLVGFLLLLLRAGYLQNRVAQITSAFDMFFIGIPIHEV